MANKVWKDDKLAVFCLELGLSLNSGIPVNEIIYMLSEGEEGKKEREQMMLIYKSLENGNSLTKALEDSKAFPVHMIDMISIGEKTGNADKVFMVLSEYYNGKKETKSAFKSAFTYPAVIAIMLLIVLFVLLSQVLPIFKDTFNNLGLEMSPIAMSLMNFGLGFTKYFSVILILILVFCLIALLIYANDSLRIKITDKLDGFFSGTNIGKKLAIYNFASSLKLVLSSGMDIDESLKTIKEHTTNKFVIDKIDKCIENLNSGESISEAISSAGLFPPLYSRMISVGFKTGKTDEVMKEIVERTKSDLSASITHVTERVEPTIVIVMSLIIGLVLLSVMLPLMGIMTAIS
ncbi:MAG: type II secretion system F family protein [Clostridia bacterium]|nr:type II secretion system F family protein [Clostridia bacterium]